jgi:two-component system, NarL family, invasion response regulator UvrY
MIGPHHSSGPAPHDALSDRELSILCQLAAGKNSVLIAKESRLTVKTVSTYRMRILEKLHLRDTAALIDYAMKHGLS